MITHKQVQEEIPLLHHQFGHKNYHQKENEYLMYRNQKLFSIHF